MEVREKVLKILKEEFGLEEILETTVIMNESTVDEGAGRESIMRIEEECEVEITEEEAQNLITVQDLINLVTTKTKK
jgi:acyl carrier protein